MELKLMVRMNIINLMKYSRIISLTILLALIIVSQADDAGSTASSEPLQFQLIDLTALLNSLNVTYQDLEMNLSTLTSLSNLPHPSQIHQSNTANTPSQIPANATKIQTAAPQSQLSHDTTSSLASKIPVPAPATVSPKSSGTVAPIANTSKSPSTSSSDSSAAKNNPPPSATISNSQQTSKPLPATGSVTQNAGNNVPTFGPGPNNKNLPPVIDITKMTVDYIATPTTSNTAASTSNSIPKSSNPTSVPSTQTLSNSTKNSAISSSPSASTSNSNTQKSSQSVTPSNTINTPPVNSQSTSTAPGKPQASNSASIRSNSSSSKSNTSSSTVNSPSSSSSTKSSTQRQTVSNTPSKSTPQAVLPTPAPQSQSKTQTQAQPISPATPQKPAVVQIPAQKPNNVVISSNQQPKSSITQSSSQQSEKAPSKNIPQASNINSIFLAPTVTNQDSGKINLLLANQNKQSSVQTSVKTPESTFKPQPINNPTNLPERSSQDDSSKSNHLSKQDNSSPAKGYQCWNSEKDAIYSITQSYTAFSKYFVITKYDEYLPHIQDYLINNYGTYLSNGQVIAGFRVYNNYGDNSLDYQLLYSTLYGTFTAILTYWPDSNRIQLKSLSVLNFFIMEIGYSNCFEQDSLQQNCKVCNDGYRNFMGRCQLYDPSCLRYLTDECGSCVAGKRLFNGLCQ